jgi:hypothetical protein
MALKSVVEISVDDGQFQRFAALFAKYQTSLNQTSGMWRKVGDEVDAVLDKTAEGVEDVKEATDGVAKSAAAASVSFRQTFIAVSGQAAGLGKVARQQDDAAKAARSQATAWADMARNARSFAGHIGEATRSLLRWASLTGLISGILGGGGLFGIERLATSAGNSRRSALGLGVTPGEEKAFGLNYGRVVEPSQFLGGVNEALHDVTKRVSLLSAGLTEKDLAGKDTAGVAAELIPALKRLADSTPDALMAQTMTARHLDQFLSLQDFQRLKATPASELNEYAKQYQTDSRTLDLGAQQQKAWQDLQVQLHRAGETIETVFIRGLTPLAPQIERLSAAFTKAVADILANPQVGKWIDELADKIRQFAEYLGTDRFHKSLEGFIADVEDLAKKGEAFAGKVGDFVTWVGSFEDEWKAAGKFFQDQYHQTVSDFQDMASSLIATGKALKEAWDAVTGWLTGWRTSHVATDADEKDAMKGGPGTSNGITPPPDTLWDKLKRAYEHLSGSTTAPSDGAPGEPRGIRNNNPLNLAYAAQTGTVGSDGRFGIYKDQESGVAAAENQLLRYQDRDHLDTLSKIISKWAPANENDTASYIADVSKRTGFGANDRLDLHDKKTAAAIIEAMGRRETGRDLDPNVVNRGVDQALGNQIRQYATADSKARDADNSNQVNNRVTNINNTAAAQSNARATVNVNISNATGGNAVVSASQLAY